MTLAPIRNELSEQSDLFVFSDYPASEADKNNVQDVREYIKTITGFKSVTIIERDRNMGLAKSIISGITEVVNEYGQVIVLEDDMLTSRYFLKFMNEALELYRDEEKVISTHGYIFPVKTALPETFFLKGADCWGWATWKRGWQLFEPDGRKLLDRIQDKKLQKRFDINGSYPYTKMLKDQVAGKNNSWAVRWYASAFLENKLTLYPGKSLVCNIGLDATGTHGDKMKGLDVKLSNEAILVKKIPVEENPDAIKAIEKFLKSRSIVGKIKGLLRTT
jgi:hypothetical protein